MKKQIDLFNVLEIATEEKVLHVPTLVGVACTINTNFEIVYENLAMQDHEVTILWDNKTNEMFVLVHDELDKNGLAKTYNYYYLKNVENVDNLVDILLKIADLSIYYELDYNVWCVLSEVDFQESYHDVIAEWFDSYIRQCC